MGCGVSKRVPVSTDTCPSAPPGEDESEQPDAEALGGVPFTTGGTGKDTRFELSLPLAKMVAKLSDIVYFSTSDVWCTRLPEPPTYRMSELPVHFRHILGHIHSSDFAGTHGANYKWGLSPLPSSMDVPDVADAARMLDGIIIHEDTDTEALLLLQREPSAFNKQPTVYLVFRGTEPSATDLLTDLAFIKRADPCAGAAAGSSVHRGFAAAYASVQPLVRQVTTALFSSTDAAGGGGFERLVVAGHSLGGALATLAAKDLSHVLAAAAAKGGLQRPAAPHVSVYTFGSPRVGNADFVRDYDGAVPDTWRFVNERDIVPCLPPMWLRFGHVGNLVWVNERSLFLNPAISGIRVTKLVRSLGQRLKERATDHSMLFGYFDMISFHRALASIPAAEHALLLDAWRCYTTPKTWDFSPTVKLVRDSPVGLGNAIELARTAAPDADGLAAKLSVQLAGASASVDDLLAEMAMGRREGHAIDYHGFVVACGRVLYREPTTPWYKARRKLVQVAALYDTHDGNGNGALSIDEFRAILACEADEMRSAGLLPVAAEDVAPLFERLDVNRSHALSKLEFAHILYLNHATDGDAGAERRDRGSLTGATLSESDGAQAVWQGTESIG